MLDRQAASVLDRQPHGEDAGLPVAQLRLAATGSPKPHGRNCAQLSGFSLDANSRVLARARAVLERLCKYLCGPAITQRRVERLSLIHI